MVSIPIISKVSATGLAIRVELSDRNDNGKKKGIPS